MSEQFYTGVNYISVHSPEVHIGEKITTTLDRLSVSLQRMYERVLNAMADTVISKLDL